MNEPGPPPMTAKRIFRPSMEITGFSAILCSLSQKIFDRANYQFMILFLRKSRDRDRTDQACPFDNHRETATVSRVVIFRDQVRIFNGLSFAFEELSHIKRTVPKAVDQAHFSLYP